MTNPLLNLLSNLWTIFLIAMLVLIILFITSLIDTIISTKIEEIKMRRQTKKAIKTALNQYKKSVIQQFDELSKDTFNKMK